VQSGQKAFHHTLGDHLDPAEPGDVEWVEEIESSGTDHGGRNVLGFPAPGNVDRSAAIVRLW
jgi:hypothetical protein